MHISQFKKGRKANLFKLKYDDCKIYHNIQCILNLFKISALYVPSQYKDKAFLSTSGSYRET